jgi:hypothetical protein
MNPIVLGALIGAIPALLAGALATWAAVRTSRVSLEQTELTLAAEHARWLRDKQAEMYVEMIRFLQQAMLKRTMVTSKSAVTEDLVREIDEAATSYGRSPLFDLTVQGRAFASSEVNEAFAAAMLADNYVWRALLYAVHAKPPAMPDDPTRLTEVADKHAREFTDVVRHDLGVIDSKTPGPSPAAAGGPG